MTELRTVTPMLAFAIVQAADAHSAVGASGGTVAHIGKSFLFDYGELVVRMRYVTDTRLEWEQIKGPQVGLKAEREYGHSVVRSDIVFFWWEEKDLAIVTQVVDFGKGSVHTTWISSDRKAAGFQGEVKALE
jgi:hypothetical protein